MKAVIAGMGNSIFISYRRDYGSDFTSRLHEKLSGFGFDVYYDSNMHSGLYMDELNAELERATDVIVVLSKCALKEKKEDVFFHEIKVAIKLKKNIIPVFLNNYDKADEISPSVRKVLDYQGISEIIPKFYDKVFIPQLIYLLTDSPEKQKYMSSLESSVLTSRMNLEKEPLISRWANAKVIKSCAYYSNQLINSDLINCALREGAHLKFLVVEPECDAAKDAAKYKLDGPEYMELFSFNNAFSMLKHKADYLRYQKEHNPEDDLCNGILEVRKTKMFIPTAILIIEKENPSENTAKVDIYTFDTSNPDRRSIMIKASDTENYSFFDNQFELLWNKYSEEI